MKKKLLLINFMLTYLFSFAQMGVNTSNPQGVFHIDGKKDNAAKGTPTVEEQANDFIVTQTGSTGIGTVNPDPSSILDIQSKDKGILGPRISLSSPTMRLGQSPNATGLLIYNTGPVLKAGYYFWNGSEWKSFNGSSDDGGSSGSSNVKKIAAIGSLVKTNDNGKEGYAMSITSPDGKFSVRTFIPTDFLFSYVNLQIRNNSSHIVDIMSNEHYLWAGAGGYMQSQLRLPSNIWAGDNATSSPLLIDATQGVRMQTSTSNPAWGDPETYALGKPEQRLYAWTTTDPHEKVFYRLFYMMGSTTPSAKGNPTTCPNGTCESTKVYFSIEQTTVS